MRGPQNVEFTVLVMYVRTSNLCLCWLNVRLS